MCYIDQYDTGHLMCYTDQYNIGHLMCYMISTIQGI